MPLSAGYARILNDLNRDVLRAQPSDPLQFCANWFNSKLEEQRKGVLGKEISAASSGAVAPDASMSAPAASAPAPASQAGVFSSANPFGGAPVSPAPSSLVTGADDDEEEDAAAFTPPPAFHLGRRTSVSAESLVPGSSAHDEIKNSVKTFIPKTEDQLNRITKATQGNLLFRHLEEDQYKDVLLAMKEVRVQAGQTVIEQGAQGDYFYVVEEGSLDVYIRPAPDFARSSSIGSTSTDDGPRTDTSSHLGEKKVSYGPSASFGELALLYAQPRAATVLSTSPCILWALDRVTFRSILMETNNRRREMYESFIKEVPLFEHLSGSERAKISDALELKTYEPGQEIVKQGERGTEFYVIVDGEAEVRKKTLGREEETVGKLGKGDYFGELALLNKAPRAATILASSSPHSGSPDRLRVATLSESAFTRLLGPLSGIMGRHAQEHYGTSSTAPPAPGLPPPILNSGLAATDFGEIAPHSVAPAGLRGSQPGSGTWINGLGASPFGGAGAGAAGSISPRA